MGEFAYDLSGSSNPIVKKYQIGGTFSNAGVLAENPASGDSGITACSTTAAADVVGITYDTATYVTAQQTDGTSPQRYVSVAVNPLAVYRYIMSGGATEGTALTLRTVSAANSDGLTVTTASGDNWASPQFDGGTIWYYTGINAGRWRKITGTSSNVATVTVAFDNDDAVGDTVLYANATAPADTEALTAQFTTNLYQVDSQTAVGSDAAVTYVELELYDIGGDGRTKSSVYFQSADHVFNILT